MVLWTALGFLAVLITPSHPAQGFLGSSARSVLPVSPCGQVGDEEYERERQKDRAFIDGDEDYADSGEEIVRARTDDSWAKRQTFYRFSFEMTFS